MAIDDKGNWQQRYYDALEELERKERDWTGAEDVLRRAISRLTLAAEGQDEALDKQLADLRLAIRNGIKHDAIKPMVEGLSRSLAAQESSVASTAASSEATPGMTLAQLISRIQWPDALDRQAKTLQKRLQKARRQDEMSERISDFAALIRESISLLSQQAAPAAGDAAADLAEGERKTRGGFLSRMFAARGEAADGHDLEVRAGRELLDYLMEHLRVDAVQKDRVNALRQAAKRVDGEQGLHHLADELAAFLSAPSSGPSVDLTTGAPMPPVAVESPAPNEVLMQLLERLVLPQEYQPQAEAIKEKLEHDPAAQGWRVALAETADLVTTMRSHIQQEKRELELFLGQVTERLDELDKHLQGDEHTGQSSLEKTRALDATLKAEVAGISDSVNASTDIVELKNSVHSRLDAIAQHMDKYLIEEEHRHSNRQAEVEALTDRLHMLENEANALQRRVAEERAHAYTDPLTGVPNRMALEERLEQEVARQRRFKHPLALSVLDVDYFKKINDTYGHLAGDKVLKTLADKLCQNIRETDFLARYGGEEFVVLMPGADIDAALGVADKLRQVIESCGFHFREQAVPVTISCGVSAFQPMEESEAVFERADAALYRAKHAGRNRCELG